jgi:class 3 adenylate cyclase
MSAQCFRQFESPLLSCITRAIATRGLKKVASSPHIPGARFVEFQGVDHSWWTEDRDEIIDEIEEILTENKPAREADRVLATVLFTDIVGSTQGWWAAVIGPGWSSLNSITSWCGRS